MKRVYRSAIWLAVLTFLLMGGAVLAQQTPQSNWAITAGVFPTSFASDARLASDVDPGNEVDLENDLGLESRLSNFRLEGMWRFKPRHSLLFAYTSWRRKAERNIDRTFDWQGNTYTTGTSIRALNNAQFIKLAYEYALKRTETTEIDFSAGVDTIWNKLSVEGQATFNGPNGPVTGERKADTSFVAPAPVFGFNIVQMVTPKVPIRGSAEWLKVKVDQTTGTVLDLRGSADYLFTPAWGAGLGYNYVAYKIDRPRFTGKYDFSGPLIYVSYRK